MPEGLFKFSLNGAEIQCRSVAPRHYVDVNPRQGKLHLPECLSDIALDPVADHGATDLFTDRGPQACLGSAVVQPYDKETPGSELVGRVQEPEEFEAFPQAYRLGKRCSAPLSHKSITWLQCRRTVFCGPWPVCA